MRPVLGALASIVLTGAAVAVPMPLDLPFPGGPDPSGEMPHAPARRPAAHLVVKPLPKRASAPKPVVKAPMAKKAAMNKVAVNKVAVKKVPVKKPLAKAVAAKGHPVAKTAPAKFAATKPVVKATVAKKPIAAKPVLKTANGKKPVAKNSVAKALSPKHAPFVKAAPVRAGMKPAVAKHGIAKPGVAKPSLAKRPAMIAPKKAIVAKKPVAKAAPVRIGAPNAERGAVQAKYDAMSLMIMRRDGNRLATLFLGMTTPDFVYRDKKGKALNRTQLVGQLRTQMKMVKAFKRSGNKIVGFGLKGTAASAQLVSQFAMVFQNGKKGVTVSGESVTNDTWIKTAKGWKLRAIRTLRESVKYNGKAI